MTTIKASYAICTKLGEITNQIVGTKREIVPGDLIKIMLNKGDRYVVKIYDPDNKRFGKDLYQCEKINVSDLDDDIWRYVSELEEGVEITMNVEMPNMKEEVNFCIKQISDVPSLGPGRFFVLDIIDTPYLSEDSKFKIRMKYYNADQRAICIRIDNIIRALVVRQPIKYSMQNLKQSSPAQNPLSNGEAKPKTSTRTHINNDSKTVPEASLIDFDDMSQIFNPYETYMVANVNKKEMICRPNNGSDPYYLRNGLNDLRDLMGQETSLVPNGMNEYAHSNQYDANVIDQHLYKRNVRIQETNSEKSSILFTPQTAPPDNYGHNQRQINEINRNLYERFIPSQDKLVGSLTNMVDATPPSAVKDFRVHSSSAETKEVPNAIRCKISASKNVENSSMTGNFKQFELPAVQHDEQTDPTEYKAKPPMVVQPLAHPQMVAQPPMANQPPPNYVPQTSPHSTNQMKKKKQRKPRRRNQQNDSKVARNAICYNCRNFVRNAIQLDCQHVFCSPCLIDSISCLDDAHCPMKNGSYICGNKLDMDDIKQILDTINRSLAESDNIRAITTSTQNIGAPRAAKPKPSDEFVYHANGSNEVLFYCKQDKCEAFWFVDKTEGRRIYPCPICDSYNCFQCQAIHDNMSCEDYNQHNSVRRNDNKKFETAHIENEERFNQHDRNEPPWECTYCTYRENSINSAICGICAKTNNHIKIKTFAENTRNNSNERTWECQHCTYRDNQMDTAICAYCSRTNDDILKTKTSSATEYYRLLELEENDNFIPNFDEFECVICADMIQPDNGVQLRGCLHNFCQACLRKYIEGQDQPNINCPFDGCTNVLEDREIKTLVSPQAYARHLEISLRVGKTQIKNGYQCCVVNCQGWWIFTEGIYNYNCPACRTENCISCKATHPGIDCKTYQQNIFYSQDKNGVETRQRLEQMLKSGEAEHCPKCNIIVVKNGGCPQMNCSMCRTKFVWGQKINKDLNIK